MLRRISLLINPSRDHEKTLNDVLDTFDHFADPVEKSQQITSAEAAFSGIDEITDALLDSPDMGRIEKHLIRRSLPEVETLRDRHKTLTNSADLIEGADRRKHARDFADAHVFKELALYGVQLSGVADHAAQGKDGHDIDRTADSAHLLWQTLANSATSARISGMHAVGGLDHVISETGIDRQDAEELLSEWPGTGVGFEEVKTGDHTFRNAGRRHPGRRFQASPDRAAPGSPGPQEERREAIRAYGGLKPDRGQIIDALRVDSRAILDREMQNTTDDGRKRKLEGALKGLDILGTGDPITGGGAAVAERLVENDIVRDPEARKRLLGIAHLTERHQAREDAFITTRVSAWKPDKAPLEEISRRAHSVHKGVIASLQQTASPRDAAALKGISKFLDTNHAETLTPQQSLKVTQKLATLVDPHDGKSTVALRIAERATQRAAQRTKKPQHTDSDRKSPEII